MKIKIQDNLGSCCGDDFPVWITREVSPQELKSLIDNYKTIKIKDEAIRKT